MRSFQDDYAIGVSLAPAARTASANGSSADLKDCNAALVIVHFGAWTDGTHTPSLEESADDSTWTAVAAGDLDGSFTAKNSDSSTAKQQIVGYKGTARYIRVVMTIAGSPSTGMLSSACILRKPNRI